MQEQVKKINVWEELILKDVMSKNKIKIENMENRNKVKIKLKIKLNHLYFTKVESIIYHLVIKVGFSFFGLLNSLFYLTVLCSAVITFRKINTFKLC